MRLKDKIAIKMARKVTMVEIAPVMARLPEEKIAPISGVRSVVPQVGQPAPRAIRPVIMPAFSTLAELEVEAASCFLCQRKTMRPIRALCKRQIAKT